MTSPAPGEALARASTLPFSFYHDKSVFNRERDAIFRRNSKLVARIDDLARPGDFVLVREYLGD